MSAMVQEERKLLLLHHLLTPLSHGPPLHSPAQLPSTSLPIHYFIQPFQIKQTLTIVLQKVEILHLRFPDRSSTGLQHNLLLPEQ
jgi:hypothetical protein